MKSALIALALACAACHSATLSEADRVKVVDAAGHPGDYGGNLLGEALRDTTGYKETYRGQGKVVYRSAQQALAYNLVLVPEGVTCITEKGKLTSVEFRAFGMGNGNRLQGAIAQLYGPLAREGFDEYYGRNARGIALVKRGLDGSCHVMLFAKISEYGGWLDTTF